MVEKHNVRTLALQVLPHFSERVLAKRVQTYGYYAKRIGLPAESHSVIIGPAMHVIGAACVFQAVPVAPLEFVRRSDGEWRGVFESDALERIEVLPHYNDLFLAARLYTYTQADFERVAVSLKKVAEIDALGDYVLSQHRLWHIALRVKPKGSDLTYFQRALTVYKEIVEKERRRRATSKKRRSN